MLHTFRRFISMNFCWWAWEYFIYMFFVMLLSFVKGYIKEVKKNIPSLITYSDQNSVLSWNYMYVEIVIKPCYYFFNTSDWNTMKIFISRIGTECYMPDVISRSSPGADPGFVVRGGAWVGEGSGDCLRSPSGPEQSPGTGHRRAKPPGSSGGLRN